MVVMVSEPSQPAASTGWTASPIGVKAVDPYRDDLKPLFDVVLLAVVELTAQSVSKESSQIATSINEKFGIEDVVFLSRSMEERRRGSGPIAAVHVDRQQQLRLGVKAYSHFASPSTGFVSRQLRSTTTPLSVYRSGFLKEYASSSRSLRESGQRRVNRTRRRLLEVTASSNGGVLRTP